MGADHGDPGKVSGRSGGVRVNWLRISIRRLRGLFGKGARDRELSEELESHLQMHIDDNLRAGMTHEEARRNALIKLGGIEQTKESVRDRRGIPLLETLLRDLRFALRMLRKNPGFTFVVVFTLALGVGANTAIFSILESQLWRPLSFPDSERLVDAHVVLRANSRQWDVLPSSVYRAWHEQSHSFAGLGAYDYPTARNFTAAGTSERVAVMPVTSSLLDTLAIPLERGRAFLPEEDTTGRDRVAILSHALWQTRFASDASVVGKSVTIDGQPYTIVGIASPHLRFEYIHEPAIYVPLSMDPAVKVLRNTYVIARLAPGVNSDRARVELDGILQRQLQADGARQEDVASVSNLRETWTDYAARPLYFFAGAVLLVLLIACVNNAGLLLARGLARQREFALRATLGAGRAALIRQSLAESLLLSLAGGAAGTIIGIWGSRAFALFWSEDALPRTTATYLDIRVLLFVVGVSIATALLMGIVPALLSSRVDVSDALRKGASGLSASPGQHRTRNTLVAVEVSLALVLLFGAGLFLSSFIRLEQAPRGFDAPGALTFQISLRGENYAKPEQQLRYFDNLTEQLRLLPGVRQVTFGSGLPLTGSTGVFANVNVAGRPPKHEHGTYVTIHAVTPSYFQALHMHLLAGRNFDPHDAPGSARVAILNRNAAAELLGREDPLGKVLDFVAQPRRGVPAEPSVQIVGLVENAQEFGADEVPQEDLFVPFAQHPLPSAYTLITAEVPRGALVGAVREAAYSLDKDQPIFDIKTMDDRIDDSLRGARFNLILVACLAGVALALVSVGIFGTVAYFVERRTQEFGIRLALGATPARVLRHAVGRTLFVGAAGLLFGVTASLLLGRILRSALYLVPHEHTGMLYGVKIYDPFSMSLACALLLAVLFLASLVPARRAMRVDPIVALRYE
jgi:predicted permease